MTEDHPFSVACKLARFLYRESATSRLARDTQAAKAAASARRAERMLAEYQQPAAVPAYLRQWRRKGRSDSIRLAAVADQIMSGINGHTFSIAEVVGRRGIAELYGDDRVKYNAFRQLLRRGSIVKVSHGLYRRVV